MSHFDILAKQVFSAIANIDTMGENAIWHKSKSQLIEDRVLFNDPTEPVQIGKTEQFDYRPTQATAEYYGRSFDGLKKKVDAKVPQYMTVKGKKYKVTEVTSKFDGKTFVAHLEPYL